MADETYKGDVYCVKCKEKREAEGKVAVSDNGRRMAKGQSPRLWHEPEPHPRQGLSHRVSRERPRSPVTGAVPRSPPVDDRSQARARRAG